MKIENIYKAELLVVERKRMQELLEQLNLVNQGEAISVPTDSLNYVDKILVAKGLISLLIESIKANEDKLKALGVEL